MKYVYCCGLVYYVHNDAVPNVRPASQPVICYYYMRFLILFVVKLTYILFHFTMPTDLSTHMTYGYTYTRFYAC